MKDLFGGALIAFVAATSSVGLADARRIASDRFAAPQIMIFEGKALSHRIVLSNIAENLLILAGDGGHVTSSDTLTEGRRYLDVWMYWGPRWSTIARDTAMLRRLATSEADQHGRFYPRTGRQPAILSFDASIGGSASKITLSDGVVALLKSHGIPIGP